MSSLSGHVDFSSFEPLHSRVENSNPILFLFFWPETVYIILLNVYAYMYNVYIIYILSPRTHIY